VFVRRDPKTKNDDIIARADEAENVASNLAHKQILFRMHRCRGFLQHNGDSGYFRVPRMAIDFAGGLHERHHRKYRAGDMTWTELSEYREKFPKAKETPDTEIALFVPFRYASKGPNDYNEHLKNLRFLSRQKQSEIRSVDTEILNRPALAFGCPVLRGRVAPSASGSAKSDYLSAFITCFLPIVLLYYPMLLCGSNLAKNGSFTRFWPSGARIS